jgi:hypothetical protein
MQSSSSSLPAVQAILIVPFWLPTAPRPMGAEERKVVLDKAAKRLNNQQLIPMAWKVLELGWSSQPHFLAEPKTWHPKTMVARKGAILKGTFTDQETLTTLSNFVDYQVNIVERSIIYYDYGVCSLEYVFEFRPLLELTSDWDRLCHPSLWQQFRDTVMQNVHDRQLEVVKNPTWTNLQKELATALKQSALEEPSFSPSSMLPISDIFSLSSALAGQPGHISPSYGINFVIFDGLSQETSLTILSIAEAVLGGPPINKENKDTFIPSINGLRCVFYGSVHTLIVVQPTPDDTNAYLIVNAARSLFRYLWMGYGILTEASRGLLVLQSKNYLRDATRTFQDEPKVREMINNIEIAAQISHLLISEFHFSMFWESEIEYEVYHRAYTLWRLTDLFAFIKDNLTAVAATALILYQSIERQRQRWIALTLGAISILSVVNATNSFMSLLHYHDFIGEGIFITVSMCLAVLILMFIMFLLNTPQSPVHGPLGKARRLMREKALNFWRSTIRLQ